MPEEWAPGMSPACEPLGGMLAYGFCECGFTYMYALDAAAGGGDGEYILARQTPRGWRAVEA